MKALVYLGPAKKALEERPKPQIKDPTDAIVKITKTTICGQVDLPSGKIMLTVEDAWVRLQGFVDWEYQKNIAGTVVKNLKGVKGIFDNIS